MRAWTTASPHTPFTTHTSPLAPSSWSSTTTQAARDLLRRHLEAEGVRVLTASSGEEGLRLARPSEPALITLDVLMPGLDGWAVLGALKSDPATAEIPVIMLTILDERDLGYAARCGRLPDQTDRP